MVSVKQLFFPIVIFVAILVTVQGELNSLKVNTCNYEVVFFFLLEPMMPNQARLQFQGEALFFWYAKEHFLLHTPLDECRYTSPAGDTSVMMPISV